MLTLINTINSTQILITKDSYSVLNVMQWVLLTIPQYFQSETKQNNILSVIHEEITGNEQADVAANEASAIFAQQIII